VAVGFAFAAVLLLTVNAGGLPWVSLVLPLTFGLYGFFRKSLPMPPLQGFTLEVLILCIPALGYVLWLAATGQDHFVTGPAFNVSMLLLCWRREAAALYDAGPHAVHDADDVVFLCDLHLQRTVLGSTAWCIRADLGRACALYLVDAGRASPGPGEGLIFTIR